MGGDVEFDKLLDAVKAAVALTPDEDRSNSAPASMEPPKAANDNGPVWPLIPFPEGWYAS